MNSRSERSERRELVCANNVTFWKQWRERFWITTTRCGERAEMKVWRNTTKCFSKINCCYSSIIDQTNVHFTFCFHIALFRNINKRSQFDGFDQYFDLWLHMLIVEISIIVLNNEIMKNDASFQKTIVLFRQLNWCQLMSWSILNENNDRQRLIMINNQQWQWWIAIINDEQWHVSIVGFAFSKWCFGCLVWCFEHQIHCFKMMIHMFHSMF